MILFNRQVLALPDKHEAIFSCVIPKGAGSASSRTQQKVAFLRSEFRLLIDKTMHHVTVAIEKSDAPTNKPARELADGISGTEQNGDVATSPTKRALWKLKSDLMGAAVERWLKSGISPAWLVLWSN